MALDPIQQQIQQDMAGGAQVNQMVNQGVQQFNNRNVPQRFAGRFSDAFNKARSIGAQTFNWNGKLYNTKVAAPQPEMARSMYKPPVKQAQQTAQQSQQVPKQVSTVPKQVVPAPVQWGSTSQHQPQQTPPQRIGTQVQPRTWIPVTSKHVTTIEQARNVLRGRDALPQYTPKTYNVEAHKGFLEHNSDAINTVGSILGGVMTTANFGKTPSWSLPSKTPAPYNPSASNTSSAESSALTNARSNRPANTVKPTRVPSSTNTVARTRATNATRSVKSARRH